MAEKSNVATIDKSLLIWGLVIVVIATLGTSFLTGVLLRGKGSNSGGSKAVATTGVMFSCGEFTVNLADKGPSRFIQAAVTLELDDPKVLESVREREPEVRDLLIGILRSKTAAELQGVEGMQSLREEMKKVLNQKVAAEHIRQVYFTQLVIP